MNKVTVPVAFVKRTNRWIVTTGDGEEDFRDLAVSVGLGMGNSGRRRMPS